MTEPADDPRQPQEPPNDDVRVPATGFTDGGGPPQGSEQPEVPVEAPEVNRAVPAPGAAPAADGHARRVPWLGLRVHPPMWLSILCSLLCVACVASVWWILTRGDYEERIISYLQLPSMTETWKELPQFLDSSRPELHLPTNTWISLKRVGFGFLLAVLVGYPAGVLAGCFPTVRSFLMPLVLFGRNIPVAALTALAFALFGTGELQKVMFIFIACFAFIIADTIDAVNEVAQRYVETARTLGARTSQIIFKVLVPLSLPTAFNSMRVLFGLAFGYIMLVEIIHEGDGGGGLGFLLNRARGRGGRPEIMVIILLTIPFVAWLIDQCLYVLQCWLFRWKYGREAEGSAAFRLSRKIVRLFWRSA